MQLIQLILILFPILIPIAIPKLKKPNYNLSYNKKLLISWRSSMGRGEGSLQNSGSPLFEMGLGLIQNYNINFQFSFITKNNMIKLSISCHPFQMFWPDQYPTLFPGSLFLLSHALGGRETLGTRLTNILQFGQILNCDTWQTVKNSLTFWLTTPILLQL